MGLTGRPSYNEEKFLAYDAFLTGWVLAHPRYRALGTRPVAVFVSPDARTALAYAQQADRVMTGRIGAMGSAPQEWHYGAATTSSSPQYPTSTTTRSPRGAPERRNGGRDGQVRTLRHDARMAQVKDVFVHDDPVARFVVSMWAVRNDLEYVAGLVGKANTDEAAEFTYLVRLAMAHLFEGAEALRHYRETFPAVNDLLKRLPPDGQKMMRKAQNAASQVGGKALLHSRVHTFHYPSPDPDYNPTSDAQLGDALKANGREQVKVLRHEQRPDRIRRLVTADEAMLSLAMDKHHVEREKLSAQVKKTVDGATAFVNFVGRLWTVYQREYDVTI